MSTEIKDVSNGNLLVIKEPYYLPAVCVANSNCKLAWLSISGKEILMPTTNKEGRHNSLHRLLNQSDALALGTFLINFSKTGDFENPGDLPEEKPHKEQPVEVKKDAPPVKRAFRARNDPSPVAEGRDHSMLCLDGSDYDIMWLAYNDKLGMARSLHQQEYNDEGDSISNTVETYEQLSKEQVIELIARMQNWVDTGDFRFTDEVALDKKKDKDDRVSKLEALLVNINKQLQELKNS